MVVPTMEIKVTWNDVKGKYEAITMVEWDILSRTYFWGEGNTPSEALVALAVEHTDKLDSPTVIERLKG